MMEYEDVMVKSSPGLCRCCLSEGCYKDMATEYSWMDETEVYADMLLECFDISISQHAEGPNGPNRLICEVCITRLRDACNFKKQVLESEKKFVDMVGRGEFVPKVMVYPPMKEEAGTEPELDEGEAEYLDEDMHFDDTDDEPLRPPVKSQPQPSGSEGITVSELKVKGKRGRPKKTEKPEKRPKREEKTKPNKAVVKSETEEMTLDQESMIKRNRLMKKNIAMVLQNSTAVPFYWHRNDYLCFVCRKDFKDANLLFEHTKRKHNVTSLCSAVSALSSEVRVKINITNLACKICNVKFDDINSIIDHLKTEHKKSFNDDYEFGIIPFRFNKDEFQCGLCEKSFQYFVKLNQHMNEHYEKHVCEACGKSFLSRRRLKHHLLVHVPRLRCSVCAKTFSSNLKRNAHESKEHNLDKKVKCTFINCNERFNNYNARKKHLNVVHGETVTEFDCPTCGKKYYAESRMLTHLRSVHEKEKNFPCSCCGKMFFSRCMVQKHIKINRYCRERTSQLPNRSS